MVDDKTEEKWNRELIEIHRRCITTYLGLKGVSVKYRKMFWKLYELEISEKTIRYYYIQPIQVFIRALVRDELDQIRVNWREDKCRKRRKKLKA